MTSYKATPQLRRALWLLGLDADQASQVIERLQLGDIGESDDEALQQAIAEGWLEEDGAPYARCGVD